jgi:hypothetical protein
MTLRTVFNPKTRTYTPTPPQRAHKAAPLVRGYRSPSRPVVCVMHPVPHIRTESAPALGAVEP